MEQAISADSSGLDAHHFLTDQVATKPIWLARQKITANGVSAALDWTCA